MLVLDRNMQFMDSISRDCDSPSWYFSTGSIAYLQTFGPASNYFISMYFFHLISICLCNPPVSWKVQPWFTTPSVSKAGCASYKTFWPLKKFDSPHESRMEFPRTATDPLHLHVTMYLYHCCLLSLNSFFGWSCCSQSPGASIWIPTPPTP